MFNKPYISQNIEFNWIISFYKYIPPIKHDNKTFKHFSPIQIRNIVNRFIEFDG